MKSRSCCTEIGHRDALLLKLTDSHFLKILLQTKFVRAIFLTDD